MERIIMTMMSTHYHIKQTMWIGILLSAIATSAADATCERLKATLTYTQEKAPRDLSSVLPVVVEKINRVLDGVVDVEVEWSGAEMHGRVGEHLIKSTVTRLARPTTTMDKVDDSLDENRREVTTQCFYIPFTIIDTNECTLMAGHPMRHKCQSPSICLNTNGSYECICPQLDEGSNVVGRTIDDTFWEQLAATNRSLWELSFNSNSRSSCPGMASTHGCCPESGHTMEGQKCRNRFHCPSDPCPNSECAETAICIRAENPTDFPTYTCKCPVGLLGNGKICNAKDPKPEPKVMFDGKTPTESTIKSNFCGCTKPIIDACSGFPPCKGKHEICTVGAGNTPKCACKPGFVFHEKLGCVDENPPTLKLRHNPNGDDTLRLKQGEEYREYMVDIVDDNAEDYLRSLKVSYSEPLPPGCLIKVGEFHVNYTVAMPWAKDPFVRVTRRVIIEDTDECRVDTSVFERSCPALVPQCDVDAGAKCVNTLGSYQCQCPKHSSGDGFKKDSKFVGFDAPDSYRGGTGCVDTSKPVISLRGPNPKVFKICECGGLSGIMSPPKEGGDNVELLADQRRMCEDDIKEMVKRTAGAELCATPGNRSPKPVDCVRAVDRTYKGDLDLSDRVVVGVPVRRGPLQWQVPYNVKDDAGNAALTVWRDVIVEEVELSTVERSIREEIQREYEAKQQTAIDKAIRAEKAKWDRENGNNNRNRRSSSSPSCPTCPDCTCPDTPQTTKESCSAFCEEVSKSCSLSDESLVFATLFWLENLFPTSILPGIVAVAVLILSFLMLRFVFSAIYNPNTYQSPTYETQSAQVDDSSVLRTSQLAPVRNNGLPSDPPRHSVSLSGAVNNHSMFSSPPPSFASPTYSRVGNGGVQGRPVEPVYDENIYLQSPIITPSRTGDGVRRRNL